MLARRMLICVLPTLVLGASLATPAPAAPLAPTKPSTLVTARASGVPCPENGAHVDVLVTADGTTVPFVIPPKHVFVITGLDWAATTATPSRSALARVSLQGGGSPLSTLLQTVALADVAGITGGNFTSPTGIPVRGGRSLCIEVIGATPGGLLHGYFTKDK